MVDQISREALLPREEQMRLRELIDLTIVQTGDPVLASLGVEGVQAQIRESTGDPSSWDLMRFCASEFRPRAYE